MIVIREAQMAAFSADLYRRFRAELTGRVLDCAQRRAPGTEPQAVAAAVEAALVRAAGLGITGTAELHRLGELLVALGPEFDTEEQTAWAGALLRCTQLPAATRLGMIAAAGSSPAATPPQARESWIP